MRKWIRKKDLLKKITELEAELARIKEALPICGHCHNIRDKNKKWHKIADFLHINFGMDFTHGICPECSEKHYPDLDL